MQQFLSANRSLSCGLEWMWFSQVTDVTKHKVRVKKNPITKGNRFFNKVLQSYYFLVCILSLYLLILG